MIKTAMGDSQREEKKVSLHFTVTLIVRLGDYYSVSLKFIE